MASLLRPLPDDAGGCWYTASRQQPSACPAHHHRTRWQRGCTPQNGHLGRLRSSFDLQLEQKGTYKIAIANSGRVMGMYELNGERQRVMGSLDDIIKQIPADAEKVNIIRGDSRIELFVTSGNPTEEVLKPTGQGLDSSRSPIPMICTPTKPPSSSFCSTANRRPAWKSP
ncbi:DUF4198 domain-containing protein [Halopseudomonas pachastrellae]|nr:DUF4198 domain-containing protein [Halopseudomonas pachastrellae]